MGAQATGPSKESRTIRAPRAERLSGRYRDRTCDICRVKAEPIDPLTRENTQKAPLTGPFAFSSALIISHHLVPLAPPARLDALASSSLALRQVLCSAAVTRR
jgi:hypothetical protein